MASYPAPPGPPPPHDYDGDGEGYPTHNPYAAAGGYEYASAGGQVPLRTPPTTTSFGRRSRARAMGGGGAGTARGFGFQTLVNRAPLRPLIMFSTIVSALFLALAAYTDFRALGSASEPAKLKVFDGIQGGLFTLAGVIELFGIWAAAKGVYRLAQLYSVGSCVSFGATLAAQLLGIIVHFSNKGLILDACTTYNTGRVSPRWQDGWFGSGWGDDDDVVVGNGTSAVVMDAQAARTWCTSLYKRLSSWSIVWFLASAFIGALFVLLSFAFARQLLDPTFGRRRVAPSAQYAAGGGGGAVPELRYDAYPMGPAPPYAGGAQGARRSTDSDYAWDSRDAKSPAYDPYSTSYGGPTGAGAGAGDTKYGYEDAPYGGQPARSRGADGDASTLVGDGESERKAKFGGVDEDEENDEARRRRPGSSREVRGADHPV